MQDVLEQLMRQAYLFDDPRTYQAGVQDAVEALQRRGVLLDGPHPALDQPA